MFNLKRLKEVAKPETIEERRSSIVHETHLDAIVDKATKELEEERNKRLQSEMILWHQRIRRLRNLIFPCLLLMILTSCEERIHNKLEILNLKGEILNSYDNISFIEYAGNKIKFRCKDTVIVTNQLFRYESIYNDSGY